MKKSSLTLLIALIATAGTSAAEPTGIKFTSSSASSPISSGVAIPADRATFSTSGTGPAVIRRDGATTYERYGDTYTQGVSTLKNIEAVLASEGLTLKDVVYLRVYVVPDPAKGGKPDFEGWAKAYGEFFNNEKNPVRTARSTIGVQSLWVPDWLIEIEAVAVYPEKR